MPSYSASRYGSYSVTIPANALNTRFSVGAASGGGSYSASGGWYWGNGGFGRSGDFRLQPRSTSYTLYFYLGQQGGFGIGPDNPGGYGGYSPVASGGAGHRSGGGGGGASAVYDGGLNRYIVFVGGGGGAGRFGQETGYSGYFSAGRGIGGGATTGSLSGRNGQNAAAGHRGGGGGGSSTGGAGSLGGAQTYNGYAGIGGNSGYYQNSNYIDWTFNSGYSNYGDGFYTAYFEYGPPAIQYFTLTPSQIVSGNTIQLGWSVTGTVNTVNISNYQNNVGSSGSVTLSPTSDTIYTLVASGPGGTRSASQTVDVIVPPTVTLFTDRANNTIVRGESINLNWTITGDASTAELSPGVGAVNIGGGPRQVSPTVNTTYTLTASHPLAGQASDQVTVYVIQAPDVSIVGPVSVDYGSSITLSCEASNATQSLQVLVKYYYLDGTFSDYELIEELQTGEYINTTVIHTPTYNNIGPSSIEYKIYAIGQGGLTSEDFVTIAINIDQMPDLIDIPESDDKIKNEDPVISPDEEVTSQQIVVTDIDIPVEIKADLPIQVEIDNSGVYVDVRRIE